MTPPIDIGGVFFSGHVGPVVQQVVVNYVLSAAVGVPLARPDVQHWFNIGNEIFENGKKSGSTALIPGQLLGNGKL